MVKEKKNDLALKGGGGIPHWVDTGELHEKSHKETGHQTPSITSNKWGKKLGRIGSESMVSDSEIIICVLKKATISPVQMWESKSKQIQLKMGPESSLRKEKCWEKGHNGAGVSKQCQHGNEGPAKDSTPVDSLLS